MQCYATGSFRVVVCLVVCNYVTYAIFTLKTAWFVVCIKKALPILRLDISRYNFISSARLMTLNTKTRNCPLLIRCYVELTASFMLRLLYSYTDSTLPARQTTDCTPEADVACLFKEK